MSEPLKLCLFGASGRMGRMICALASAAPDLSIVGAVGRHDSPHLGRDVGELAGVGPLGVVVDADPSSALLGADAVIDFSLASAFDRMLRAAMQAGVPVVSGTTRLSPESEALIDKAATKIPVLWAPNTSLGISVLAATVKQALAALGADYDVEVVEAHHNQKADAPSGTATFLAEAAREVRPELRAVFGREGPIGKRSRDEIGMHALRGGGVIGDHTVHLIGPHDRLELTHRAMSRELFAAGALRAARFIVTRPPGRYALADMFPSEPHEDPA
ncbi:MAG: 4-hydroxy-tetrahydrodipicolinate reductase [Polyangiaceae bacterium]